MVQSVTLSHPQSKVHKPIGVFHYLVILKGVLIPSLRWKDELFQITTYHLPLTNWVYLWAWRCGTVGLVHTKFTNPFLLQLRQVANERSHWINLINLWSLIRIPIFWQQSSYCAIGRDLNKILFTNNYVFITKITKKLMMLFKITKSVFLMVPILVFKTPPILDNYRHRIEYTPPSLISFIIILFQLPAVW